MDLESAGEEQVYWEKWTHFRDPSAGDYLIKKYMPLVSYHVQRISAGLPKSVSRDDLRSFGLIGLYDAIEKFDHSRDLKFDTYASFRVRGAIIDGLRKEDWLPRSAREKAKKIEAASVLLEQKLMRNVTAKEIADELGITEDEVYAAMTENFYSNVLSMDENPAEHDDKEGPSYNLRDDNTLTPEENVMKEELISDMTALITTLNEKEQLVISLFYKEELTLTEIGQVMGLSTSRISQIHSRAIYKLRECLEKVM